jgi:hypothetical protein
VLAKQASDQKITRSWKNALNHLTLLKDMNLAARMHHDVSFIMENAAIAASNMQLAAALRSINDIKEEYQLQPPPTLLLPLGQS